MKIILFTFQNKPPYLLMRSDLNIKLMNVDKFVISPYDINTWRVYSVGSENTYLVDLEEMTCTCDDFLYREKDKKCETCKHMRLVQKIIKNGLGDRRIIVCVYIVKGISHHFDLLDKKFLC